MSWQMPQSYVGQVVHWKHGKETSAAASPAIVTEVHPGSLRLAIINPDQTTMTVLEDPSLHRDDPKLAERLADDPDQGFWEHISEATLDSQRVAELEDEVSTLKDKVNSLLAELQPA